MVFVRCEGVVFRPDCPSVPQWRIASGLSREIGGRLGQAHAHYSTPTTVWGRSPGRGDLEGAATEYTQALNRTRPEERERTSRGTSGVRVMVAKVGVVIQRARPTS